MEGYIDFVIDYKNGKKEITVVNSGGVNCSDVPTDKVARKLMGENVEIADFAHTDQYYDEQSKKGVSIQEESHDPFIQRRKEDEAEKGQQIDI